LSTGMCWRGETGPFFFAGFFVYLFLGLNSYVTCPSHKKLYMLLLYCFSLFSVCWVVITA
jgi:hypothetical protein